MLPNDATTVAALFGTWRAGGVYTPLNPAPRTPSLPAQLEILRPVAVITTPDLAHRFSTVRGYPSSPAPDLRWAAHPSRQADASDRRATTPMSRCCSSPPAPPERPNRYRCVHTTVLDLIDRLLAKLRGAKAAASQAESRAPMPNLVPLSLSLWAGIYQVLFAFRAGSGVVLMDRFSPADFADLVAQTSAALDRAAAGRADDGAARRVGDRPVAAEDRAIDHRSPVAGAGRRFRDKFGVHRAQLLRPDRTRRRGRRLVRRRCPRVRRVQARFRRPTTARHRRRRSPTTR